MYLRPRLFHFILYNYKKVYIVSLPVPIMLQTLSICVTYIHKNLDFLLLGTYRSKFVRDLNPTATIT